MLRESHRPEIELATCKSQVQCITTYEIAVQESLVKPYTQVYLETLWTW